MKSLFYPTIFAFALLVGALGVAKSEHTERSLASQKALTEQREERSALCAKKTANYVYVLDRKFYSEEGAQRIYEKCLNE